LIEIRGNEIMKTSRLHGPRNMKLEEVSEPVITNDEVLIRVREMGVCGSDLHMYTGERVLPYPRILGHEFAGDVVKVGANVTNLRVGQRVTAEPNFWCGKCVFCQAGRENLCVNRVGLAVNVDGCQAEYVKVPAPFVWPLPDKVTYTQGAMVEPLMVSLHAWRRSGGKLDDTVTIIGCGTIGLMALLCAKAAGARILAVDVIPEKLELARKLGANEIINSRETDAIAAVKQATSGLGSDIVIESAGFPVTVEQSLEMVRQAGRIMMIGLSTKPAQIPPMMVARREVEIFGSFIYHAGEFASAIRLIDSGQVNVLPLVGLTTDLAGAQDAYDQLLSGKAVKGIIKI
jgi:L-iditol 2-dehydrogenase